MQWPYCFAAHDSFIVPGPMPGVTTSSPFTLRLIERYGITVQHISRSFGAHRLDDPGDASLLWPVCSLTLQEGLLLQCFSESRCLLPLLQVLPAASNSCRMGFSPTESNALFSRHTEKRGLGKLGRFLPFLAVYAFGALCMLF